MADQIPEGKRADYDRLIANHPDIEKKGKTMPYTSHNGHMFTHLSKEGKIGMRLSEEDRDAFLTTYNAVLFEQHGRVMKEFVEVPDELTSKTEELSVYLRKSFDYVCGLKPKPSKRK